MPLVDPEDLKLLTQEALKKEGKLRPWTARQAIYSVPWSSELRCLDQGEGRNTRNQLKRLALLRVGKCAELSS